MTDPYRLPRSVTPRHYGLRIAPDLETFRFEGTATIDVTVHEPVDQIVLNAAELEIHSAAVRDAGGAEQAGVVTLDEKLQRATIALPAPLPAGEAALTIVYTGTINDRLRGFYRSVFTDGEGREHVIATTQFESTDARRAFPCWDEPEHKATFEVSLMVPDGLLGLSNTAAVSSQPAEGGAWVTFDRTMKMSTYLVAFIVGPLVATEAVDVDGVPLRVVTVPGREKLVAWALETGAHALRYFADYFAIPYPAGKLDLVGLPDFAAGAMENLGCVTFRETALLVDKDRASRNELERIADTVTHEIAHMWFGDLVTMKWWNGIWLNEAFATFMALAAVDHLRPEWERWTSFSTERSAAMVVDGLVSTRPIEYEVVSPADAEGMFDVLTYLKGGAALRMLEQHLGAERFRDGIRLYLARHEYGNTETTDLWDALEESSGEPVRAIMDSWIYQGGYPLITVERTGDGLLLSQARFRYLPNAEDDEVRWKVPVPTRALDGGEPARLLLSDASAALRGDVAGGGKAVVVNAGGWGVFRTRYQPPLAESLRARFEDLGAIERFNLVSDAWALAEAGRAPVEEFLGVAELLRSERDASVWNAGLDGMYALHRDVPAEARDAYSAWVRALAGPGFEDLGWQPTPDEGDGDARLRAALLATLGTIGSDEAVIARTRELHGALLAGKTEVTPDLLAPMVETIAWNGGPDEYKQFWERIRAAATPQEEVRYLFRLPSFPSEELLLRTLDATLGEIRHQNGGFVIAGCLANRVAGRRAWKWLKAHWDEVRPLVDITHGRTLGGIVRLTDAESLHDVPAFLEEHPVPNARLLMTQYLERQRINAAFAARERAGLAARFSA